MAQIILTITTATTTPQLSKGDKMIDKMIDMVLIGLVGLCLLSILACVIYIIIVGF